MFFYMHYPTQDSTYHGLCYISRGALTGMKNSSMKDWSNDPSHHEQTLYDRATSCSPDDSLGDWTGDKY